MQTCYTVTGDVPQLLEESLMSRPEIGPDSVVAATCSLNRDVERSAQLTPGKHRALVTHLSEISLRHHGTYGVKCVWFSKESTKHHVALAPCAISHHFQNVYNSLSTTLIYTPSISKFNANSNKKFQTVPLNQ